LGGDLEYLAALCAHWASDYDFGRVARELGGLDNGRRAGLHFAHGRAVESGPQARMPVLLIHGWPGAAIEFTEVAALLNAAGHDVVIPSLPGFGFSERPERPLNVAANATPLRELMAELGYERYAVQGGDWGSVIGARLAFDAPRAVAGLHVNTPGVLPVAGDLADPPLSDEEVAWIDRARAWQGRDGAYLPLQGTSPDSLSPGLYDSPAGLAAWLVDKYRRWTDCDGEIERCLDRERICDLLSVYWLTGTVGSSMRIYAAEARDRWRLAAGEAIEVPAAVGDFPAEILRPPRAWSERVLSDLRRWTEFDRGGHFAALEQPRLLADDLIAFLAGLG
jgi:microsomal epoxide hydrolase